MKNGKSLKIISMVLVLLFFLMQLVFMSVSSGGGWCSPFLGAPVELGHPVYRFSSYGFPIDFVIIVKEDCYTVQSTTFEWNPIGFIIDGALLALLAFPLWRSGFKKNPAGQ